MARFPSLYTERMKHFALMLATSLTLAGTALGATSQRDTDAAANAAALAVDGLLSVCPPSVRQASAAARCVTADGDLTATRKALTAKLKLYGAWRADTDGQRVYNWVVTPSGYVNLGVVKADTGSLLILTPSQAQATQTQTAQTAQPSQAAQATPAKPANPLPPFRRTLRLTNPRMHGEDVRLLQLRLMEVSRVDPGKGGDGWYGPVTTANVMVFQSANGLPATGVVTTTTWNTLFSKGAKYFDAQEAQRLARSLK